DGTEVSPGEARRLACGAGLIPAVLGGPSAVLDVGREQRLFTRAQRIALTLRDKGCRAEGCDRPPSWTEAHHFDHWSEGGTTDLDNAVLLCGFHHRLAHHDHYTHTRQPNGDIRYHRRT
ncbi:MAG TPA: HNH endonuclease signature motif containing protein, partial [Marmoricola sp.]|nr:HNH endonuclease signature motif containing protein [Marmoricola sp.]